MPASPPRSEPLEMELCGCSGGLPCHWLPVGVSQLGGSGKKPEAGRRGGDVSPGLPPRGAEGWQRYLRYLDHTAWQADPHSCSYLLNFRPGDDSIALLLLVLTAHHFVNSPVLLNSPKVHPSEAPSAPAGPRDWCRAPVPAFSQDLYLFLLPHIGALITFWPLPFKAAQSSVVRHVTSSLI